MIISKCLFVCISFVNNIPSVQFAHACVLTADFTGYVACVWLSNFTLSQLLCPDVFSVTVHLCCFCSAVPLLQSGLISTPANIWYMLILLVHLHMNLNSKIMLLFLVL